jgi:hypothetical protein
VLIPGRRSVLVTVLLAGVLLGLSVRPRRVDKLALKEAGQWILMKAGPGARIGHYRTPRIVHYAEGRGVDLGTEAGRAERETVQWIVTVESGESGEAKGIADRIITASRRFKSGRITVRVVRLGE